MHSIGLGAEKYVVLAMQALRSLALASLECFARQFMKVLLVATSEVAAAAEAHLLHDGAHAREAFVVALPGVEQHLPRTRSKRMERCSSSGVRWKCSLDPLNSDVRD